MDIQDIAAPHRPKAGSLRLLNRAGELHTLDPNGVEKAVGAPMLIGTPVNATKASATLSPAGANNDILITAVAAGPAGNSLSAEILAPSANLAYATANFARDKVTVTPGGCESCC